MKNSPFHLSLPCLSISRTRKFYESILGANIGRNTHQWIDIDLFGNQITFTKSGKYNFDYRSYKFEDAVLPSFHFGVIVNKVTWNDLYKKLSNSDLELIQPVTFLENKNGEHQSFFVVDPNGYTVEFKAFQNANEVFVN